MKTHIMFRRALTALAFAAALALPSAPGRAQTNAGPQPRSEPMMTQPEGPPVAGLPHPTFTLRENTNTVRQKFPPPAPPTPAPTAPVGPPSATPVQYDLEIENSMLLMSGPNNPVQKAPATLPNIVKLLTEEHSDVNIAMAPELKDVQVEDLKLHATQVGEELEALRIACGNKFKYSGLINANHKATLFTLEPSLDYQNHLIQKQYAQNEPQQIEVFNLTSFFDRVRGSKVMDDNQFLSLKQSLIEMTRGIFDRTLADFGVHPMLGFLFHDGSNLLMVKGNAEDIMVARKIINAMIEPPPGESNSARPATERSVADKLELSAQLAALQKEKAALEAKFEALRKSASGESSSPVPIGGANPRPPEGPPMPGNR